MAILYVPATVSLYVIWYTPFAVEVTAPFTITDESAMLVRLTV